MSESWQIATDSKEYIIIAPGGVKRARFANADVLAEHFCILMAENDRLRAEQLALNARISELKLAARKMVGEDDYDYRKDIADAARVWRPE